MSEHASEREQRTVHILRPRFELSPFLQQELLEFVEPVNGIMPTIVGAYATREVVLDSDAFHSGKYGQKLVDQYRAFENYPQHILFGEARTSRTGYKALPPALRVRRVNSETVHMALRPRHQETFDEKVVGILDFKAINKVLDESGKTPSYINRLKPYADKQPLNRKNYMVVEIGGAALKPQFRGSRQAEENLASRIGEFTEALGEREGIRYYALTSEIKGREEVREVEKRAPANSFPPIELPLNPNEDFDVA